MPVKERVFQAILFESIALLLSFALVKLLSPSAQHSQNQPAVIMMLIGISVIAMIWTFCYNVIFDKFFSGDKLARPIWLRVLHIIGFEAGLLLFTLPLVMYVMNLDVLQAFLLDISLSILILVYGFIFYWVYDVLRAKLLS